MMAYLRGDRIGLLVEPKNDVNQQAQNEQADCRNDRQQDPIVEKLKLLRDGCDSFLETDLSGLWIPIGKCNTRKQRRKPKA
jgi:hypothetical protein